MAAFHAQQTAEKHMKAWLIALGDDEPPLIHDLVRLGRRLAAFGGPSLPSQPLRTLSRLAVAPRYAVAHVTLPEVEEALAEAERVVAAARDAVAALMAEDDPQQAPP
jgi:HEPN domain-containing protein